MLKEKNQYLIIRNGLGILGVLLPILTIITSLWSPNTKYEDWFHSISATYWSSPMLIMILSAVSMFLIIYRSYSKWDTLVNTLAGISGLGIVCFPCKVSWIADETLAGMFWLPVSITNKVHIAFAIAMFTLLAINSLTLFSKSEHKKKNICYKVCGSIMILSLIGLLCTFILNWPTVLVLVFETVLLLAFGISWLVKGHVFDNYI